jgi:hypothetical protein
VDQGYEPVRELGVSPPSVLFQMQVLRFRERRLARGRKGSVIRAAAGWPTRRSAVKGVELHAAAICRPHDPKPSCSSENITNRSLRP